MFAHVRAALRFSFVLSSFGLVIGYIVSLFTVAVGRVAFPISSIVLAPLVVLFCALFMVTIPVIVMAHLFTMIAVFRAFMGLGRRLFFGTDQNSGPQWIDESCPLQIDPEYQGADAGLWDRWIDGFW